MRLRVLTWLLASALLGAALVQAPLFAVPSLEPGLVVGALAALASAHLALRRAQARPVTASLRWGLLERTPGEQVAAETRAQLAVGAGLVGLPLLLLVSRSWLLDCRTGAGLAPFLMAALPAVLAGTALGSLAGSVTRRPRRAALLVVAAVVLSVVLLGVELVVGPRHLLHQWILGPLSASALTGYSAPLDLPSSAWLHRLFAVLLSCALLAASALVRTWTDAPPSDGPDFPGEGDDLGWRASRASDATRARFLLAHSRRRIAGVLAALGVALAPFLAFSDECGLTPGRARLERELPVTIETPHARLHFAIDSPALARARLVAAQVEAAHAQACRVLGLAPEGRLDAWIHRDEDSMFELTGARGYLFAAPWNRELHVLAGDAGRARALRHELVHVVAAELGGPFGVSLSPGLTEGLATAVDEGQARRKEAHEAVAGAAKAGLVPPARELMSPVGFFAGATDRAYRASASFVGWLLLERGPEPLRRAWALGDFEAAYGADLDELDRRWRRFLAEDVPAAPGVAAAARERFDPRRHRPLRLAPCARIGRERTGSPAEQAALHAAAGDHEGAAELYCEAWELSADPLHLQAALAQALAAGRLDRALALAERGASSPTLPDVRREDMLRKRYRLLAALGRPLDAGLALAAWRQAGLSLWPEEQLLEQDALARPGHEAYFRAVLSPGEEARARLAAQVEESPDFPAALHELLLREAQRGGPWQPELEALAERFAALPRSSPALASAHFLGLAARAESAGCWDAAERLAVRAGGIAGARPLQALAAEDAVERARIGARLELAGLPAQQPASSCRR